MEMLNQLGVNSTLGLQMVMFLVVFAVLKYFLYEPYFAAFLERKNRTLGKTELAERYMVEAREMEDKYALKAREANDQFRQIYDQARVNAVKESDRVISEAREKSKGLIEASRAKIEKEMQAVRGDLKKDVAPLATLIGEKLIGKDLSV